MCSVQWDLLLQPALAARKACVLSGLMTTLQLWHDDAHEAPPRGPDLRGDPTGVPLIGLHL